MISTRRTARAVASAGAVVVVMALTGCAQLTSLFGGAERDSGTNEVTDAGTESVFDIQVGDCLLEPDISDDEVSDIEVVPCSQAHDYEFYHQHELTEASTWPGASAIRERAEAACYGDAFTDFVGLPFDESPSLWPTFYSPTEVSWEQGDRLIQCLVYQAADDEGRDLVQVEGSLEGSKR